MKRQMAATDGNGGRDWKLCVLNLNGSVLYTCLKDSFFLEKKAYYDNSLLIAFCCFVKACRSVRIVNDVWWIYYLKLDNYAASCYNRFVWLLVIPNHVTNAIYAHDIYVECGGCLHILKVFEYLVAFIHYHHAFCGRPINDGANSSAVCWHTAVRCSPRRLSQFDFGYKMFPRGGWAAPSCSAILGQPVEGAKQASVHLPREKNWCNIERAVPAYQILHW